MPIHPPHNTPPTKPQLEFLTAPYRFTGKDRDMETVLDYFEARYLSYCQAGYDSELSIWLSVDPNDGLPTSLQSIIKNHGCKRSKRHKTVINL